MNCYQKTIKFEGYGKQRRTISPRTTEDVQDNVEPIEGMEKCSPDRIELLILWKLGKNTKEAEEFMGIRNLAAALANR